MSTTITNKALENFKKVVTNGKDYLFKNEKLIGRNKVGLKKISSTQQISQSKKKLFAKSNVKSVNVREIVSNSSTELRNISLNGREQVACAETETPSKRLKKQLLSQPIQEMTDERLNRFAVFEFVNNRSKAIIEMP